MILIEKINSYWKQNKKSGWNNHFVLVMILIIKQRIYYIFSIILNFYKHMDIAYDTSK